MAKLVEKFAKEGITFEDGLLIPGASNVLPDDVVVSSHVCGVKYSVYERRDGYGNRFPHGNCHC